jgi:Uma2 family endonuclease
MERAADGTILMMSPTGSEGEAAELNVAIELGVWARSSGAGKVFGSNAGFKLPDSSIRAADAALVCWPRWNALTVEQRQGFAPICPDFVIELRSRTDRLGDLQGKMALWTANGAEVSWLIDPLERIVWVYRVGAAPEVHEDPKTVRGSGIAEGFVLEMSRVWE